MKKVVHYQPDEATFIYLGLPALVKPVDHPDSDHVSNTKYVATSPVIAYDPVSGHFETVNTMYKPVRH